MRLIRSAGGFDGLAAIGRQCGAFLAYLRELASVIGHAARIEPMRAYCSGLAPSPSTPELVTQYN